jgi:hypothetical protein
MAEIITIQCIASIIEQAKYNYITNVKSGENAFIPAGYALMSIELKPNEVVQPGIIEFVVRDITDNILTGCVFQDTDLNNCLWIGSLPSRQISFTTNKYIETRSTNTIINPKFNIIIKYCSLPIGDRKK